MLVAVLSGFLLAAVAPRAHRFLGRRSAWLFALLPLGLCAFFGSFLTDGAGVSAVRESAAWVPSLGVRLSFSLDGLSLLMSLLVCGIGALVVVYAGTYLEGHRDVGRFFAYLFLFMASMLGLVLADNLIALFVFWELTSLSSYFLIGVDHERAEARAAALQALLVTGVGGLALLAGFILLGTAGGTMELSELLARPAAVRESPVVLPALILLLVGAFTKSAQFPFHFWLPSAMEAPTPVSAYLHSATMVKAGVYLLARVTPLFQGTAVWEGSLILTGGVTLVVGAAAAMTQHDLKRILAYTTVASLGMMTLLFGIGTPAAVNAAVVSLLAHALYKGALFLVAGAVDHETGSRDVRQLCGLRRAMPLTAAAAGLAALSMAGVLPALGYVAKEMLYEAQLHAPRWNFVIAVVSVAANALLVAAAAVTGLRPFAGAELAAPRTPQGEPLALWFGPALLAALGVVLGIGAAPLAGPLVTAATSAILASPQSPALSLWHGFTVVFALSLVTLAAGAAVYALREPIGALPARWPAAAKHGPAAWYDAGLRGLFSLAEGSARLLQSGRLRYYIMIVLGVAFLLLATTLAMKGDPFRLPLWPRARLYEWITALIILTGAVLAVTTGSRLTAVAALGVVGYGVALLYTLLSAPDLAMTQFSIETLSVVLFVLVLYRLPRFARYSRRASHLRDIVVALANGGLMTALVLAATAEPARTRISTFFLEHSLELAQGRNTVNVILVDFRALDTLGEIIVLAAAALGVYALLKLRLNKE